MHKNLKNIEPAIPNMVAAATGGQFVVAFP